MGLLMAAEPETLLMPLGQRVCGDPAKPAGGGITEKLTGNSSRGAPGTGTGGPLLTYGRNSGASQKQDLRNGRLGGTAEAVVS